MSKNDVAQISFHAIQVSQRGCMFYLAALPALNILPLCSGLRKDARRWDEDFDGSAFVQAVQASEFAKAELEKMEFEEEAEQIKQASYEESRPFQRIIDEARVRNIAAYLRAEESLMPNAVILATRESADVEVQELVPGNSVFKITVTWGEEEPLNILDGQHRIEALRKLKEDGYAEFENFMLPFSLLIDIPFYMQAETFAVINGRQKPVNRSLIYDLLGYMPMGDEVIRDRAYRSEVALHRFCHKVVKVLDASSKSPWNSLIKMRGAGKGIVSQAAFVDQLALLTKPRKNSNRLQRLPLFYPYFRNNDLVGLAKLCVVYFLGVKAAWPQYWADEQALRESLFGKTNGIAVMFMVLHDLVILLGGVEAVTEEAIMSFWGRAPSIRIEFPPAGGGRGYQNEWYRAIMQEIGGVELQSMLPQAFERARERLALLGGLF